VPASGTPASVTPLAADRNLAGDPFSDPRAIIRAGVADDANEFVTGNA
jgi:hypothetical protein